MMMMVMAIAMVNLKQVRCAEAETTMIATSFLNFEQNRQAFWFGGVPTQASGPIEPIAVERAFGALDLGVALDGSLGV